MLKIHVGDLSDPRLLYNVDAYFNNQLDYRWLETEFAKEVVKDIDHSELISPYNVMSPVLGSIPTTKLSGGTKALLLMKFQDERIINASNCGDNCSKWILKIAEEKDLTINLYHIMDFGENPFEAYIINNDTIVHNMKEFVLTAGEYL